MWKSHVSYDLSPVTYEWVLWHMHDTWRVLALQPAATHCNTLQPIESTAIQCNPRQPTATHCNPLHTLQPAATHRNTPQPTATHCNYTVNTLQNISGTWRVLVQHAATHCNSRQLTAAHLENLGGPTRCGGASYHIRSLHWLDYVLQRGFAYKEKNTQTHARR